MSQKSRQHRQQQARSAGPPWLWIVIGGIVVLFALAFFLTKSDEPEEGAGSDQPIQETGPVAVDGDALALFEDPGNDVAVGSEAPVLTGKTFEKEPISIGGPGKPTVVVFLAHWCPHCQAEVPRITDFIDAGEVPSGVEIVSVATSTSETQANYPPSGWLEREGWQPPVMVDTEDGTAADAYGLSTFPYFVFLNSDGTVDARISGEIEMNTFAEMLGALE